MEAFIKFVLQRYPITRTGSQKWNVKIGAWPQWWVPPQKFVRTRFSFSEPRKMKMCKFGLAPNVVIFL